MHGFSIEVTNKNDLFLWCKQEDLEKQYALPTAFSKWKKHLEKNLFDFFS